MCLTYFSHVFCRQYPTDKTSLSPSDDSDSSSDDHFHPDAWHSDSDSSTLSPKRKKRCQGDKVTRSQEDQCRDMPHRMSVSVGKLRKRKRLHNDTGIHTVTEACDNTLSSNSDSDTCTSGGAKRKNQLKCDQECIKLSNSILTRSQKVQSRSMMSSDTCSSSKKKKPKCKKKLLTDDSDKSDNSFDPCEDTMSSKSDSDVPGNSIKPRRRRNRDDKERSRLYRLHMTPSQKEWAKMLARERMRKLRERQKVNPPKLSSKQKAKQRRRWRVQKRVQRARLTPVDKKLADRRSITKKLNALSPEDWESLVLNTTPRKKEHLVNKGIMNTPKSAKRLSTIRTIADAFITGLRHLQEMKCPEAKAKHKFLVAMARRSTDSRKVRSEVNVCFRTWQKCGMIKEEATFLELQMRKQRSDALKEGHKEIVNNFFASRSCPIPTKRYANKSVLTDVTKTLYKQFGKEHVDVKISLSKFRKLRPKNMLTADKMKFTGCVCEYCLNIDYMVCVLNFLMVR